MTFILTFLFISFIYASNELNITKLPSNGTCLDGFVKSRTNNCILLDYLVSSSKPLCVKGLGMINAGGCMGQCNIQTYSDVIDCKDYNSFGIGICKKKMDSTWSQCCPIGHTMNTKKECISQLKYNGGSVVSSTLHRQIVLPTIYPIWVGNWKKSNKITINHFLKNFYDSKWYSTIKQYYSEDNNQKKQVVANKFVLGKELIVNGTTSFVSWTSAQINQIVNQGHSARKSTNENDLFILLLGDNVSYQGYCDSKCGYHASAKTLKYQYIVIGNPNVVSDGSTSCENCMHPSFLLPNTVAPNDPITDSIIYQLSYHLAEAITDKDGRGWNTGSSFKEPISISGMCTTRMFDPLNEFQKGSKIGYYNSVMKPQKFLVHEVWDYRNKKCTSGNADEDDDDQEF